MSEAPERQSRDCGFSLLEVLVALALAGFVSLLILHSVGLAAHGLDRFANHAERLDERRALEMLLRRALGSALSIPVVEGELAFQGQPTSISLLTVVEDGGPGLYRVKLALGGTGLPRTITVTRHPAGRSALPGRSHRSVLVRDVRDFGIDYFGAVSPTADRTWNRRWEGIGYLPQLVRIRLDSGDGHGQRSMVLRVANGG